jgi:hypothetical protein
MVFQMKARANGPTKHFGNNKGRSNSPRSERQPRPGHLGEWELFFWPPKIFSEQTAKFPPQKMQKGSLADLAQRKKACIGTDDVRFKVIEAAEGEIDEFIDEAERLVKQQGELNDYFQAMNSEPSPGSIDQMCFRKVAPSLARELRKNDKVRFAMQGIPGRFDTERLRILAGLEEEESFFVFARPGERNLLGEEEDLDIDPLLVAVQAKKTPQDEFLEGTEETKDTILEDHVRVAVIHQQGKVTDFWFEFR